MSTLNSFTKQRIQKLANDHCDVLLLFRAVKYFYETETQTNYLTISSFWNALEISYGQRNLPFLEDLFTKFDVTEDLLKYPSFIKYYSLVGASNDPVQIAEDLSLPKLFKKYFNVVFSAKETLLIGNIHNLYAQDDELLYCCGRGAYIKKPVWPRKK